MTSTIRGPLPPSVYWRRRAFVLGVLAALLLIVVNVARGGPDGPSTDGQAAQVSGDTGASSGTSAQDGDRGTGGKKKHKDEPATVEPSETVTEAPVGPTAGPTLPTEKITLEPEQPELVDPVGHCADDDIAIVPEVRDAIAGRPVTITLQLRTIDAEACTWRVSPNHLALKITDGADEVWSSRECPRRLPTASVVVRRVATSTFDLTWNSRRSETGCPVLTDFAQAGDYTVTAAAYGGEPGQSTFDLAAPPPVETTAPATEEKADKKKSGKPKND